MKYRSLMILGGRKETGVDMGTITVFISEKYFIKIVVLDGERKVLLENRKTGMKQYPIHFKKGMNLYDWAPESVIVKKGVDIAFDTLKILDHWVDSAKESKRVNDFLDKVNGSEIKLNTIFIEWFKSKYNGHTEYQKFIEDVQDGYFDTEAPVKITMEEKPFGREFLDEINS